MDYSTAYSHHMLVSDFAWGQSNNGNLPVVSVVASISSRVATVAASGGGGVTLPSGACINGIAEVLEAGVTRSGEIITKYPMTQRLPNGGASAPVTSTRGE